MEATEAFTLKPIGHMKSVFHFKNGTPRQSSLCQNARGILVVEKSVFNNPEHSLDGLQHYSHAWILFVFHKNNNAHKKAKVKPPRLDGQRVGVFSTRSPYRPNNIGLSLAKIDKIQGASIHFSGIDILDGTPVIDIKPYIPQYDRPSTMNDATSPLTATTTTLDCTDELKPVEDDIAMNIGAAKTDESHSQKYGIEGLSLGAMSKPPYSSTNSERTKYESLEYGFYSVSNALDKAGESLKHVDKKKNIHCDNKRSESDSVGDDCEDRDNCADRGDIDDGNNDDDLLDFLVCNVISRAASDVLLPDNSNVAKLIDPPNSSSNSDSAIKNCDRSSDSASTEMGDSGVITTVKNYVVNSNSAVTAPWLSSPPVAKVRVVFSIESLDQIQCFHPNSTDPKYRTEMLSGPEDAKKAITSVLHEEPRSVYRRQKCQNSVYFFAIDVLHVTCWFDGDAVTVLRIRPVADVPQLQGKK